MLAQARPDGQCTLSIKTAIVCHPFYGLFVHNKTDIAYYRSGNLLNVSQRVRSQGATLIETNVKYWISPWVRYRPELRNEARFSCFLLVLVRFVLGTFSNSQCSLMRKIDRTFF